MKVEQTDECVKDKKNLQRQGLTVSHSCLGEVQGMCLGLTSYNPRHIPCVWETRGMCLGESMFDL